MVGLRVGSGEGGREERAREQMGAYSEFLLKKDSRAVFNENGSRGVAVHVGNMLEKK